MKTLSPFRFFLVMQLHAPYTLVILAIVLAAAVFMTSSNPATGLDDGIGMLLFVQMFLASSGFCERARRGHFDPLLTFAAHRTLALVAHWSISVLPGVSAWLLLAASAATVGSPQAGSMVWGARAAAFFIVSAVAWVAGFALARGTAGFLWTAALLLVLMRRIDVVASSSPFAIVLCPFGLLKPQGTGAASVAGAVLLAGLPLLMVWHHGRRLDIYLRERA
jgi:hypothetical protein